MTRILWKLWCHEQTAVLHCYQRSLGCADDLTLFIDLHGSKEACEWVASYWDWCACLHYAICAGGTPSQHFVDTAALHLPLQLLLP